MANFDFNSLKNQVLGKGKNSSSLTGPVKPTLLPQNHEHSHSDSPSQKARKTTIKEKEELLAFQLKNGFFDFFRDAGIAVVYLKNKDYRTASVFIKRLISLCNEFGYTVSVDPADEPKLKKSFVNEDLTEETRSSIRAQVSNFMNDLKSSITAAKKAKQKEGIEIDNIEQIEMWPNSIKTITDHALNTISTKFAEDTAKNSEETVSFSQIRPDLDSTTQTMLKGLPDDKIISAMTTIPQLAGYIVPPNKIRFIQADKQELIKEIKDKRGEIFNKAKAL